MKCTSDEWDHCRVEKMGCSGCYYDKDTLEEAINNLKKLVELRKNKRGEIKFDTWHKRFRNCITSIRR